MFGRRDGMSRDCRGRKTPPGRDHADSRFEHLRCWLLLARRVCVRVPWVTLVAQQSTPGGIGGGGGGTAAGVFTSADLNKDGFVTRDELRATFAKWLSDGDADRTGLLTQDQLAAALNAALPQPVAPAGRGGGQGAAPQNQTPKPADVENMMAALPDDAPAKPKRPRKVLVLAKAAGFVHSSIPLAAKTVEALGVKTGAWATTITYDPAAISAQNLKQYDLVFLDNTTGAFLDDPNDPSAGDARKKALLEFVRSGKGLAGIHAAGDSYHEQSRSGRSGAVSGRRMGDSRTGNCKEQGCSGFADAGRRRQEQRSEAQPG